MDNTMLFHRLSIILKDWEEEHNCILGCMLTPDVSIYSDVEGEVWEWGGEEFSKREGYVAALKKRGE